MSNIQTAIELAVKSHKGQLQKNGQPYILHPLRLMAHMDTELEMISAVLHDTVEDTDVTLDDLRVLGFSEEVIEVVDCLTHRDGESYEDYLARVLTNPVAITVKKADLRDNMDIRRLPEIQSADIVRLKKYRNAWEVITAFESGQGG